MSRPGCDEAVHGLRVWIRQHDPHVRAAVELLIGYDMWLRRPDFRQACLQRTSGGVWCVNWQAAREALDAGQLGASSTEVAVLDFAIALGRDRFRFSRMGQTNSRLLLEATARVLGVTR